MERRRLGFTLIELLVAVTIFSIIATALYSGFNAGIRVWRRSEDNMKLHQTMRLALDGMARELRNSVNFSETEDSEEEPGTEPDEEFEIIEKPDLIFSGTGSEISFVSIVTRFLDEEQVFRKELAKLTYSLNSKSELTRKAAFQSEGFQAADSGDDVIIEGVSEFKFEYSYKPYEDEDDAAWKDYWTGQKDIPMGVKIYLLIKPKNDGPTEFLKTVFIPHGILGVEEEEPEEILSGE